MFKYSPVFLLLLLGVIGSTLGETVPCSLRQMTHGYVCVCNATYCDYLDNPFPASENEIAIISTSRGGLRFSSSNGEFNQSEKLYILDYDLGQERSDSAKGPSRSAALTIDRSKLYQKIVGFGGSFTGAVSHLLDALPEDLQDHVYKSYYATEGLGFNLMRMSIGGCDFDLAPWAYNELPENDASLSNFTELDPRDERKVQQIKRLKAVSKVENLRIKGAAWSSPRWMKTNNRWTGYSRLKKEYYQTWADYHVRWLEIMERNGLPIWAISTGNEPSNGVGFMLFVRFMSLGWTPKLQAVWLADNLGPTIRNSTFKDIIIFSNDDQTFTFPYWFREMNATRSNALDYIDGLSVHWYWDSIFGRLSTYDRTLEEVPGKILITSESCIGDKPWHVATPAMGSWKRGENFARGFMANLKHGFNGWIDWNLILDEKGGPNYVNNTVDAPIIVNMTNPSEVFKQPMFYTMGHFTKFVPENSVRIGAVVSNVNIDSVAFLRPDGMIAALIYNSGNAHVDVRVTDSIRGVIMINIPSRSIHTIIYK